MTLPFVSVIMPVRNEADFITRSLTAVFTQEYPNDLIEVIIADGMSEDNTCALVNAVSAQFPQISVRIINNEAQFVSTGLNAAIKLAKGDIIVRIDGHCVIRSDYISRCAFYLQDKNIGGVGGVIETIGTTPIGSAISIAMSSNFGVGGSFRTIREKSSFVDTVAFAGYRRDTLENAGPFDETMIRNQDDEYNFRLRSLGYKILLSDDIQSYYYSRTSLAKLWKQYYQYGMFKVRVLLKHPYQGSLRQIVPALFVLALGGGFLFSWVSSSIRWMWLALISIYILVNIVVSFFLAFKNKHTYCSYLPLVFLILHTAYGIGFLHGIVVFVILKQKKILLKSSR